MKALRFILRVITADVAVTFSGEKLVGERVRVGPTINHILPTELDVHIVTGLKRKAVGMEGQIAVAAVIHPALWIHLLLALVAVEFARVVEVGVERQPQHVLPVPSATRHR